MKKQLIRSLILGIVLAIVVAGLVGCTQKSPEDTATAEFCPNGEDHEFRVETTQANCTQAGYTAGTCEKCGYTYIDGIVNALGHQWGEPVSIRMASCTEDGVQSKSCIRCGIKQEGAILHSGHNYVISSEEGDEEQETVEFVCSICGDKITQSWDEPFPQEQKEKTFLPDCSADFSFLIQCDQGENYLRKNLILTGKDGAVSYRITVEENGVYRIAATTPYQEYETYRASLSGDMIFPEYNTKVLEFSIIGPDRAEVVFNEDNLIFLKKLELKQYRKSGLYDLQWDEAAQRYYLTLFELKNIDSTMIGKVIGIGDYVSADEILADSSRELCFAKLERITHNAEGDLLLELSVPQLSEVYDKLDLYFSGNTKGMQMSGNPETVFMNAVVNSEGFAEYLTASYLAADSYAQDHGLVVTPLAETSTDNLKFELTKNDFNPVKGTSTSKLELGGKITYTIPLKSKAGHASGSIVMTCNAEITADISVGGYFNDKDAVDLHLTNTTTTTLTFETVFNLDYRYEHEITYLVHKDTHTIHTASCRIANKETKKSNLQKLTAQELSDMYNGDKAAMKQNECKVCMAVTGLDGTAYAYNRSTGVLHCMNCRHVTDIKACNLYTLYPDNTIGFTECSDCQPQKRQVEDFDNRMLNAIKGSDWGDTVTDLQEMLGDSIGDRKPEPNKDANLSVPINVAGVFNIQIGVAPVFEFDIEASVHFSVTANTTNTYGIHNVGEGFETYHNEKPGKVDYDLKFTGEADAKFGISLIVEAYPVGLDKAAYISINGQVGLYGHFSGIFSVAGTVGGDMDTYCAARLEVGLYARIDGYWKILWFDNNFEILKEQRLPLFKWGYDRMYYAFEEEEVECTVDDPNTFVVFNPFMLMQAKYLDLATMEHKSGLISPIGKSHLNVTVDIRNEDGSPCDFLEYMSENGMIHKKDTAPNEFTAVITIHIIPKFSINSLKEFKESKTKKLVYGYSLDPLVIKLKVEEGVDQPNANPYIDLLNMYHTSISCNWTNCDGKGWDVVGDPDNVCYMFPLYEKNRTLSEIGYTLIDINDDKQPELIVSMIDLETSGAIYDMYTVYKGFVIHVISAGERDSYNLAGDYSINNSGSSSAAKSSNVNYRLDPLSGTLRVNQAVIYDGYADRDNPYYYATKEFYNKETYGINYDVLQPISKDDAWEMLDSFPENQPLALIPFSEYVPSEKTGNMEDFQSIIENVQTRINYNSYSVSQKEYCRGDFFEIDGKKALILMYYVLNGSELTSGYYVGLWVENSDGAISCLTDQIIEEVGNSDDAYVTFDIRKIDGKMYLNPYVRKTNNNTDISQNQYYLIGDELVLEYDLQSEAPFVSMGDGLIQHDESKSVYYLNQEQVDRSTFYSMQDKLNSRTYVLGINPNWSEGRPPEGYTFEELLEQLPEETTSNNSGSNYTLSTELGFSEDSAQSIVDLYVPFCKMLSDTYTSSDGSIAKQRSCLVVEFETGSPNLIVHYWIPNAYDPGQFCEAWIIYGIESGEVVELYSDENYAPTRREIDMVYDDAYGFALREEQTGGYYELVIHYPTNVVDTTVYENYNYIQLSEDSHVLRVWTISGDYVDIKF